MDESYIEKNKEQFSFETKTKEEQQVKVGFDENVFDNQQLSAQKKSEQIANIPQMKSQNIEAVETNLQKVDMIQDLDVEYSTAAKRKAAIRQAYKQTGKSGKPDKLGDRQKKTAEKLAQQKRLKAYVPEPDNGYSTAQRRLVAEYFPEHISGQMAEIKTKMAGLNLENNEELSKNIIPAMAFVDQLEKFKDSVYNAFHKNALEKEMEGQIREFLCAATKISDYVKVRKDLIQNKYYALLSGKDTATISNEELGKKAKQFKDSNPELAKYYEVLLRSREKNLTTKDVTAIMAEAKKLVSEKKDGWDAFLEEGKAEREEILQEKVRMKAKMKRMVTKKKEEDKLYASDESYKEYPLLKSDDMIKAFMKHEYNKPGTKESAMLYGRYFQFGKENSEVYGDMDNTYFMSGNGSIMNTYVRNREKGLEKRKEYLLDVKYKTDKKFKSMSPVEQEDFIQKELDQWEKEAKVRIKMLKDGCKADEIPHNTHLYRMIGEDVLDRMGVRGKNDAETVANINKKAGSSFKETSFASVGYRVDNIGAIRRMPIMFTILCDKGKKCFISANVRETEILFDKPEYEIVKAELCTDKMVPLSDTHMTLTKKGVGDLDSSNESVGTFKGINITVKLVSSAAEQS